MSYRDDLDALAARHAALEVEIAAKERELAAVASMLAEARRLDRAAEHFAHAPVKRRRSERRILAAAFGVGLACCAAVGYASTTECAERPEISISELTGRISAVIAGIDRDRAAFDALKVIGKRPACERPRDMLKLARKHER